MSPTEMMLECARLLRSRDEDDSVSLHYEGGDWIAQARNPSRLVMLGETVGRYRAEAQTADAAMADLLAKVSGR